MSGELPDSDDRLPADEFWPGTAYTLYARWSDEGEAGRRRATENLLSVYRRALIAFYRGASRYGDSRFPRIPLRDGLDEEDQAIEVVHEYFARRGPIILDKWREFRQRCPDSPARHLRVFIRQDFRFHCLNLLRARNRSDAHLEELDPDAYASDIGAARPWQREVAQAELSALVHLAIRRTAEEYAEGSREGLILLARGRLLEDREYKDILPALDCSLATARQRFVRFKERLLPVLRDLIREQGGSIEMYLEEIS